MVKYVGHKAVTEAPDISDRDTSEKKKERNQVSETDLKTFLCCKQFWQHDPLPDYFSYCILVSVSTICVPFVTLLPGGKANPAPPHI